jgi:hypothetical protein
MARILISRLLLPNTKQPMQATAAECDRFQGRLSHDGNGVAGQPQQSS